MNSASYRRSSVAALAGMLLAAPSLEAHPFGDKAESHRLALSLEPGALTLSYQREVPTPKVMMDFLSFLDGKEPSPEGDRAFTATQLSAMEREIEVFVDNKRLPLRPKPGSEGENGRGDARFFTYTLNYEADFILEAGHEREIIVFNHVPSSEGAYYQNEVTIPPEFIMAEGSHQGTDAQGGWSQDPTQRTLKVRVMAPKQLPPPWLMGGALGAVAAIGVGVWRRRRLS